MAIPGMGKFYGEPQIGDGGPSIIQNQSPYGDYNPQNSVNINPNLGLPNPGVDPRSPAFAARFSPAFGMGPIAGSWSGQSGYNPQNAISSFDPNKGLGNFPALPGSPNFGFQNWLNMRNMGQSSQPANPLSQGPTFQQNAGYNPSQYATDETTNFLANLLGGSTTKTQLAPGSPFNVPPQNMIDFGAESPLNAGLLAERYAKYPREVADMMTRAELGQLGPRLPSGAAPEESQFTGRSPAPNSIFGNLGGSIGNGHAANLFPGSQPTQMAHGNPAAPIDPISGMTSQNPLHSNANQIGNNPMSSLSSFLNMLSFLGGMGGGQMGGGFGYNPRTNPFMGGGSNFSQFLFPRFI